MQECPICMEIYDPSNKKPLILQCGHTLCKQCLLSMGKMANSPIIECGECKQPSELKLALNMVNFAILQSLDKPVLSEQINSSLNKKNVPQESSSESFKSANLGPTTTRRKKLQGAVSDFDVGKYVHQQPNNFQNCSHQKENMLPPSSPLLSQRSSASKLKNRRIRNSVDWGNLKMRPFLAVQEDSRMCQDRIYEFYCETCQGFHCSHGREILANRH